MSVDEVHRMLDVAERDLSAAERMLERSPILEVAAYHLQQAAEKSVKAALISLGVPYPRGGSKGHDISILAELIPAESTLRSKAMELSSLTPWSTEFRYPSAPSGVAAVPDTATLGRRMIEVRSFNEALVSLLPVASSRFVKAVAAKAALLAQRNRIGLWLMSEELESTLRGDRTTAVAKALGALLPAAKCPEFFEVGGSVVPTGVTLLGGEAAQQALNGLAGAKPGTAVLLAFDAAHADSIATRASGDLEISLDTLAAIDASRCSTPV